MTGFRVKLGLGWLAAPMSETRGSVGRAVTLDAFSPAARAWFAASFGEPTDAQAQGWPPIAEGRHTLILAPTGSGKTLAAFLWAIDRLASPSRRPSKPRARGSSTSRRCARSRSTSRRTSARRSPGIRLAAERLGRRRCTTADRRHAHRRHRRPRNVARLLPPPARHPDHHARVALPDAHVAGARDAARASRR